MVSYFKVGAALFERFKVKLKAENSSESDFTKDTKASVQKGGWQQPSCCKPRWTVAVIIPFR